MLRRTVFVVAPLVLGIAAMTPSRLFADPPVTPTPDPIPPVFCFRIMDIERVSIGDATPGNDFALSFEVLNWTNRPATGLDLAMNEATSVNSGNAPNIFGLGVDRDGRGGLLGGSDINATGAGLTTGAGVFDVPAAHSGRGRGDFAGLLNDWDPSGLGFSTFGDYAGLGTLARWEAGDGTAIPNRDLIGAGAPGGLLPEDLIPGLGIDASGDTAIDGGLGPYSPGSPGFGPGDFAGGTGNVLDGFTLTIQDWDIGEVFSVNWFLMDENGPIGTAGQGNEYGFGTTNLIRMTPGGDLPDGVISGNSGFNQDATSFFGNVYEVPNPAEFAVEFGAGITAPFANPVDNMFNVETNAEVIPEPATLMLLIVSTPLVIRRRR